MANDPVITPNTTGTVSSGSSTPASVTIGSMTTAQRDAIVAPASGLVIYNSSTHKLNIYTTRWEEAASAVPPFNPSALSGLSAWFKADTATFKDTGFATPAAANNDPVGAWRDQSGSGWDLLQATVGAQPLLLTNVINGLPAVKFVGSGYKLVAASLLNLAEFTLFMVIKLNRTPTNGDSLFGKSSDTTKSYIYLDSGTLATAHDDASASGNISVTDPGMTNFIVHCFDTSGAIVRHFHNGPLNGQTGGAITGAWAIDQFGAGGGQWGQFSAAEIVIYNAVLPDADRASVTTYLGARYGITIS